MTPGKRHGPKRSCPVESSCWLPASIFRSGGSKSTTPEPHDISWLPWWLGNKFPERFVPLGKNWRPGQIPQEADVNGNVNGRKKRRKRIIIISAIVVVLVLIVGVAVAFSHGSSKIDPSKLAKVEKGDLAKSVVATGKVEPITKVEVKSKASGIVKKLLVEYGDRVKKGQLLAQLDKVEIEAGVEQSRASLEAAQANRKGAEADYERSKVDAESPDVP